MKLSKKTINILNNFKSINNTIVINQKGSGYISTKSVSKSSIGFYDLPLEEQSIKDVPIYDLSNFLTLLNEFKDNEKFDMEFNDEARFLLMKTDNDQIKYYYAPEEMIEKSPVKKDKELDFLCAFELSSENFKKLMKMTSLINPKEIVTFEVKKNMVIGIATDVDNPTANSFKTVLGKNILNNNFEGYVSVQTKDINCIESMSYNVFFAPGLPIKFASKEDKGLVYYSATISK